MSFFSCLLRMAYVAVLASFWVSVGVNAEVIKTFKPDDLKGKALGEVVFKDNRNHFLLNCPSGISSICEKKEKALFIKVSFTETMTHHTKEVRMKVMRLFTCEHDKREIAKLAEYGNELSCPGGFLTEAVSYLPTSELKEMHVGVWHGNLSLELHKSVGNSQGEYSLEPLLINITLNVIDGNARILFPDFLSTTPQVTFDFSRAGNGKVNETLKICLYNGLDTVRPFYTFFLRDNDASAASEGQASSFFSLRHHTQDPSEAARTDYQVFFQYENGQRQPLPKRKRQDIQSADMSPKRTITLLDGSKQVPCVPASLIFETLPFDPIQKRAGHYSGQLHINFSSSA